jgi:Zn-dependent M16 (insulinase) family peptidase
LNNQEIIDYHKRFYKSGNLTILVQGENLDVVLEELEKYPDLLNDGKKCGVVDGSTVKLVRKEMSVLDTISKTIIDSTSKTNPTPLSTKTVKFPSTDSEIGSIGYTWPGPESNDIKTIIALQVLHRYFTDNPSSLFRNEFVERLEPWASDVDMDLEENVDANLVWIFSGVSRGSAGSVDGGSVDGESVDGSADSDDSSSGIDSDSNDDESNGDTPPDLFLPGLYHSKVISLLEKFTSPEFKLDMSETLKRHAHKHVESLEESPHETITTALLPDIIRYHLVDNSEKVMHVGRKLGMLNVLRELEGEDEGFWKGLVKKYLIDQQVPIELIFRLVK